MPQEPATKGAPRKGGAANSPSRSAGWLGIWIGIPLAAGVAEQLLERMV